MVEEVCVAWTFPTARSRATSVSTWSCICRGSIARSTFDVSMRRVSAAWSLAIFQSASLS